MTIINIDRSSIRFAKPRQDFQPSGLLTRNEDGSVTAEYIDCRTAFAPPPRFALSYVPTTVTCFACGQSFPHTELKSDDWRDDEGGSNCSWEVCPKCEQWDCCQFQYEELPDAEMERLAKENAGKTAG